NAILTVFSVSAQTLTKVAEAPLGHWSQGLTFTADGKAILVQNMVEKAYSVFRFADGKLTAEAPLSVSQGSPSKLIVAPRQSAFRRRTGRPSRPSQPCSEQGLPFHQR